MTNKKPLFWCKTSIVDEIVYNRKKGPDDPSFSHELYEQMCKEPVFSPNGDRLGDRTNFPYLVFYSDGHTETIFQKEFEKRFPEYKIPEQEMTPKKQAAIDTFIKKVHGI